MPVPHKAAAAAVHHNSPLFRWLIGLGGVGLFFVAIVDSSVIPLPLPGSTDLLLLVLVTHKPAEWWLFALIAIAGAMVGGYFSYRLACKGGTALMERYVPARYRDRLTHGVQNNPVLAIGLPALLPPPVPLTPFVIAAGALDMPKKKFLWAFGVGRTLRYFIVAWLAQHYGRHLIRLWRRYFGESTATVVIVFVVLAAVTIAVVVWQARKQKISLRG
jgi:membrane protein YqaA with SNARE-associated domain